MAFFYSDYIYRIRQRRILLQYTILLVLVFMFESITGLLAYVYQEQIQQDLNNHLADTFIQVVKRSGYNFSF